MAETTRNLELIKISKIDPEAGRLQQFANLNDKIIIYSNIDGSIWACLSTVNKSNLETRIDLFLEFYYEFSCLDALYEELKIHISKFLQDFEKLNNFLKELKQRIDGEINYYIRVYNESNIKMEEFRRLEETEVGRREVEKKMTDRLMNLKDKAGYLGELQGTKEKIKAFAEKKAEVERDWNSSQEVLVCLNYLKTVLINDELSRIDQVFKDFFAEIDPVNRFIANIKQEDYEVLKNAQSFNVKEVMGFNEFMCEKIKEFKLINLDFMMVYLTTFVNHECIAFIHEQWNMYVQVAGYISAFPYFKAEIEYFLGKKNKSEFRFDSSFSRDHLKRVQECMTNLQNNCEKLGNEIQSVAIRGEVRWTSNEVIGYHQSTDSRGYTSTTTIRKPYIDSFSANLYLENYVEQKEELKPEEVEETEKTVEARIFKDKCSRDYAVVYERFIFYDNLNKEYERLKKKVVDHKNSILSHHAELDEDMEKLCLRFSHFRGVFTNKDLRIDESFNCSVFAIFLKNCNIQSSPGCCSGGLPAPLIANHITPNYLFSQFIQTFKASRKNMKTPCCQPDNLTYLNFKGIDLDDIRLVLFDLRVLGSLKNNSGKAQEVRGRIRDEEFDRSMFNVISLSIKCVAIKSQMRFHIDSDKAGKLIERWQEDGEKIMADGRYQKLIVPYQKAKFTTLTKVK